jgi:phosphoadenosine phosphosulfate reductase
MRTEITPTELIEMNQRFEHAPASKILAWAFETFGNDLVLACSFQDIVLVDLAVNIDPKVEVVFLDTEFHFPETLDFVEQVREAYGLNLTVTTPGPDAEAWVCGTDECCKRRKVGPLMEVVNTKAAWMTALKRVDAITRTEAAIVSIDGTFGVVKVNPMATWTDEDISTYEQDHSLLTHPLMSQGYRSIGCAPTTRPTAPGEDPRAGRWAGTGKVECGLHE